MAAGQLESDVAVCAGYNATCPFLPEDCPVTKDGKTELMHLVVHPKLPGVYFLGFIQAHGPMLPCVESQMSYAADLIQVCTHGSLSLTRKLKDCALMAALHAGLRLQLVA